MKISVLLFLVLIVSFFYHCTKKVAKPTPPVTTVVQPVSACDTITFAKHIKPIVDAECVSCHNASFSGANYNLYADLKEKALNGKLKGYVIDGTPIIMPKFGTKLSQAKLDLILCWINNGAKP